MAESSGLQHDASIMITVRASTVHCLGRMDGAQFVPTFTSSFQFWVNDAIGFLKPFFGSFESVLQLLIN